MTIASEISRLQTAKSCIKAAIENKWIEVWSGLTLDNYASCIDAIQTWGWLRIFSYLAVGWGWSWGTWWFGPDRCWGYAWWWWGWEIDEWILLADQDNYCILIWAGWAGPWWTWCNAWWKKWCDWCPSEICWCVCVKWWKWWEAPLSTSCRVNNWWSSWSWMAWWASKMLSPGNNFWPWWGWWWDKWAWCIWSWDNFYSSRWWDWWCWYRGMWWWGWGSWWCYWGCWCDWWWNWWRCWDWWRQCNNAKCYWWWGWGWQVMNWYWVSWWNWYQWVIDICYPSDWSYWINSATWWDCCYICDGFCVHRFTSDWTFCILS